MNKINPADKQMYLFDTADFMSESHPGTFSTDKNVFSDQEIETQAVRDSFSSKEGENSFSNTPNEPEAASLNADSNQSADMPLFETVHAQKAAEIQRRREQKVQQRYTKYCIEWLSYKHFSARCLGKSIPVIDKIDPFYAVEIEGEEHKQNFFSALVNSLEFEDAVIFMSLPQIEKHLQGPQQENLFNLKGCQETLRQQLAQVPEKKLSFAVLFQAITHYTGVLPLMKTLFSEELTCKKLISQEMSKQTALSLLVSQGHYNAALTYLRELPENTTYGQLSEMLNVKEATDKLSALSHTRLSPHSPAARFLSALEQAFPTDIYLSLFCREKPSYSFKRDFDVEERKNSDPLPWLKNITPISYRLLKPSPSHLPDTFLLEGRRDRS